MKVLETIFLTLAKTDWIEWLAVLCSLLYVILISYKKNSAWLFAILSSGLYVYLCYSTQLYLEVGLQIFYVLMAIYGWFSWYQDERKDEPIDPNSFAESNEGRIIRWNLKQHVLNVIISGVLMLLLGYVFANFTNQANPFVDAFTSVFSFTATFMVTKKVLENWIYWIIIDAISVYLFYSRELYVTAGLMCLYSLIALFGLVKWYLIYKRQDD